MGQSPLTPAFSFMDGASGSHKESSHLEYIPASVHSLQAQGCPRSTQGSSWTSENHTQDQAVNPNGHKDFRPKCATTHSPALAGQAQAWTMEGRCIVIEIGSKFYSDK